MFLLKSERLYIKLNNKCTVCLYRYEMCDVEETLVLITLGLKLLLSDRMIRFLVEVLVDLSKEKQSR